MRNHVLDLGMVFVLVVQAQCLGMGDNRPRDAVGKMFLETRRYREHMLAGLARYADDLCHLGACLGEGAGLVKDDGVCIGKRLQVLSALHDGAVV